MTAAALKAKVNGKANGVELLERARRFPVDVIHECNLCGSRDQVVLERSERQGLPFPNVMCARCGLVFTTPRPTAAAYWEFYDHMYLPLASSHRKRQVTERSIEANQRNYAMEILELLRPHLVGRKTLLDIGGSTGVVAGVFRDELGMDACVIDPGPKELARAAGRGLRTFRGVIEEHTIEERFDVVLMCQTIDHVLDATKALQKARDLLAPNGLFFVDPVDVVSAAHRAGHLRGALHVDHPFNFTYETADAMLRRVGLPPVLVDASHPRFFRFICRAGPPDPAALPPASFASTLLRELRAMQRAPLVGRKRAGVVKRTGRKLRDALRRGVDAVFD